MAKEGKKAVKKLRKQIVEHVESIDDEEFLKIVNDLIEYVSGGDGEGGD